MTLVRKLALLALTMAVTGSQAFAAPVLVTTLAGLGANASANLQTLGLDADSVAQGSSVTLTGDPTRSVSFSNTGAALTRVDEGGTWGSDFALGDALLWSGGLDANLNIIDGGVLTLTFNSAVRGAGARIQSFMDGPFAVSVAAYDSSNSLLASFLVTGLVNALAQDGSAPFVGILDDTRTISRLTFSVANDTFAIDGPQVNTTSGGGGGTQVPEPLTMTLLGLGLAGAVARRSHVRRSL